MQNTEQLTFEQFAALTSAERIAYLKEQPITTESKGFMDGTKRVGDPSAISTKHRAVVRGIPIGGWYATQQAAIDAAQEFLQEWDGEL
ncbi:hypothetical protein [Paludibacterium denitrificans]|uniref:Uncharacterized protein n=1 Tax=Paludibacterium denitrificans TaxID=2675226 RepID=A0A844G7W8_9NEIS|nr:hypothetical protein [Paludibacterium denitrificans]MTD32446.1 hypothetical protein [Paludibacterium denitrificans]